MSDITREDAIKIIKNYDVNGCGYCHQGGDEVEVAFKMAIKALEQEPCEDAINRQSIKQKLQEHHDFFVNAYGGFSNLPQNEKSRVDEITNCIAMVVNEPPVTPQPKIGHWIKIRDCYGNNHFTCPFCGHDIATKVDIWDDNYCSNCGAKMEGE